MIVFACAVVVALVLIVPFLMEPGDRAMRERERRDCRHALDQLFDSEIEREKETQTDDGLVPWRTAHEQPVD
jgi:hypothetical protein